MRHTRSSRAQPHAWIMMVLATRRARHQRLARSRDAWRVAMASPACASRRGDKQRGATGPLDQPSTQPAPTPRARACPRRRGATAQPPARWRRRAWSALCYGGCEWRRRSLRCEKKKARVGTHGPTSRSAALRGKARARWRRWVTRKALAIDGASVGAARACWRQRGREGWLFVHVVLRMVAAADGGGGRAGGAGWVRRAIGWRKLGSARDR